MSSAYSNPTKQPSNMTLNAWENLWDVNYIPFHSADVHKDLLSHEAKLLTKQSRIFVPLCGKSVDMKYLADKGHTVVGVEISDLAIEQFFKEFNIKFEKNCNKFPDFVEYKSLDSKITLCKGDLFAMDAEKFGRFDAIWDRGSFVAINVAERAKYAQVTTGLLKEDGKHLLNVFHYDGTKYGGPPNTVSDEEIQQLFGPFCTVELLNKYSNFKPIHKKWGLDEFFVSNYMLQLKQEPSPAL